MNPPGSVRVVLHRVRKEDDGVSLVEALIAVLILAVAMLALVATAATSTVSLRVSRDRQQATQLSSAALEDVRAVSYSEAVLLDDGSVAATGPNGHAVVKALDGSVPHVSVDGRFTTTTWIELPDAGKTLKHVTATTTWDDRGTERSVTTSTMIAPAQRGLPAPAFTVSPADTVQPGVAGDEVCFSAPDPGFQLQNLGGRDRYSFAAGFHDGSDGDPGGKLGLGPDDLSSVKGYWIPEINAGNSWFGYAKFADKAANSDFDAAPFMADTGLAGGRPHSDVAIDPLGFADLWFCFRPQTGVTDFAPVFRVRLYSVFDPDVWNDLTLRVLDESADKTLYLAKGSGNNRSKFELSEQVPVRTDPTDYDSPTDGVIGLRFDRGVSSHTARWDYQPSTGALIEGTATLRLWVATPDTLPAPDPAAPPDPVTLDISLTKRQGSNGAQVGTPLFAGTHTIESADFVDDWTLVEIPLTLTSTSFDGTQLLRLEVAHPASSAEASVHIAFDMDVVDPETKLTRYLSHLEVEVVVP